MSTNKVYGDNPNRIKLLEKKNRWEVNRKSKYFNGITEQFSIDHCTHSFFGASKTYADLIVQEYGKNVGLNTVSFRGGCITGPNHSGAKLHGFLSYLVKLSIKEKKYSIIGYKGKQVRDNLHSHDLVSCFWEYFKKPKKGEVYNIGGGRYSNCSINEALDLVESIKKINIKREYLKTPRVGDHIWYISNLDKFKNDYPNWKQQFNTKTIIDELINSQFLILNDQAITYMIKANIISDKNKKSERYLNPAQTNKKAPKDVYFTAQILFEIKERKRP